MGRLRLRTLVLIRWVAVIGQAGAVVTVHLGLGFDLPLAPVAAAIFAAAVTNVAMTLARPAQAMLSDREGAVYFAFDILQLALLLFLTGGVQNPFAILLLAPVAIAAATLSGRSTLWLSALALLCVGLLARFHLRLPWSGAGVEMPLVYQVGMATALSVGTLFIAFYAWTLAHAQRRMSDALAATQAALAREHRLSSLGGLAAAAAHELGSPLSTIAVVAHELKRAVPAGSPLAEDIALLVSQSDRCRDILAKLAERPEQSGGAPYGAGERRPARAAARRRRGRGCGRVQARVRGRKRGAGRGARTGNSPRPGQPARQRAPVRPQPRDRDHALERGCAVGGDRGRRAGIRHRDPRRPGRAVPDHPPRRRPHGAWRVHRQDAA